MIGDVPVTLAGTAPTWAERSPDQRFGVMPSGRLHLPVKPFPHGNTGVSTKGRGRPRTYRWRVRHQEDDLEFVPPLGQETP